MTRCRICDAPLTRHAGHSPVVCEGYVERAFLRRQCCPCTASERRETLLGGCCRFEGEPSNGATAGGADDRDS